MNTPDHPNGTPCCELCGEPMPPGETMFKFHGYSGPCPKEPLPRPAPINWQERAEKAEAALADGAGDLIGLTRALIADADC